MIGISNKQGEMLAFIKTFLAENGFPPTREEIKTGLKISTKSLVNYHLLALEEASLINRIPNTPRGLRITCGGSAQLPLPLSTPPLDQSGVLELTYDMVTDNSNLYALKVKNDVIVDAQEPDGDVVILQSQASAQNGEVVAVRLLEQNQTTIKEYHRENGHVRLESTNTSKRSLIVNPNAVEIQGKVVAVIKQMH